MSFGMRLIHWFGRVSGFFRPEDWPSTVDYSGLETAIQYRINNPRLFTEALSHRSYLQIPGNEHILSNERMEFLGDAVLNLTAAEYLFSHHLLASPHGSP